MKDLFRIDGEIAVVTGALGKLGPIWIETLLDGGASVFALDLPQADITADFKKLQEQFDESRLILDSADVRDRRALEAACHDPHGPRLYNFGSSAGLPNVHAFKRSFGAVERTYDRYEAYSRLVGWLRRT